MPKDIKSTDELVRRQFLDKLMGSGPKTSDSIQEDPIPETVASMFFPYASTGKALASSGENAMANIAKSNVLKRLMGQSEAPMAEIVGNSGLTKFNPANPSHLDAIKPHLESNMPIHHGEHNFDDGAIVHAILQDNPRSETVLSHPMVKKSIVDAGFEE